VTTDPARTRLLHLLDRLRRGVLLSAEVDLLAGAVTDALTARDVDRVALIEAIELPDGATWDRIVVAAAALQRAATAASRDAEAVRADRELWVRTYGEEIALHAAEARRYRAAWRSARRRAALMTAEVTRRAPLQGEYAARAAQAEAARDRDHRFLAEARRLRDEACERLDTHQLAMARALGFGPNTAWDTLRERAETAVAAATERADLLETARDALSTAGQNGPHADDWPNIAPGIEKLAAERDEALKRAAAMTAAMESTAADALAHSGCHRKLMAQCQRAERAEATVRDYESRLSWETACGEHARLLDACRAADERADRAEAAITRVTALANRAIGDWADIDGGTILAAIDGEQPTEPEADAEPEAPCFHPSWEITGRARRCTDCGEQLDPEPEPKPPTLVISIDLKGADIADLIRRAFHTPGSPS
jgi:hypothetical protein